MLIRLSTVLAMLIMLVGPKPGGADQWRGTLSGGGEVVIDPISRKPQLSYPGGSAPLWDGAHEMSDGSVIIVKDGVAVPNEHMYRSWRQAPQQRTNNDDQPCRQLRRQTCGLNRECAQQRACALATQLAQMADDDPDNQAGQAECRQALSDPGVFPACDKHAAEDTPCQALVNKTCGEDRQCGQEQSCDLARQLLEMEREERTSGFDPQAATQSGAQCKQAMDNSFFSACP